MDKYTPVIRIVDRAQLEINWRNKYFTTVTEWFKEQVNRDSVLRLYNSDNDKSLVRKFNQ